MGVHQLLEPCAQQGIQLFFCGHTREETWLRYRGGCVSLLHQRQPIGELNALLYSTNKNIITLLISLKTFGRTNTTPATASPVPLLL